MTVSSLKKNNNVDSEVFLDESYYDVQYTLMELSNFCGETYMFNAFEVCNHDFVVTFTKANTNEIRTLRGNLFGPDRGHNLTDDQIDAELIAMMANDLIKVYDLDKQGWRSFYSSKVLTVDVMCNH